jgi:MinD superfamily P-loop ATPase
MMLKHNAELRYNGTKFIRLETHQCRSCWKCVEVCPAGVIGKINLPFHKHIRIIQPELCKGCLKCVKVCEHQAIISLNY